METMVYDVIRKGECSVCHRRTRIVQLRQSKREDDMCINCVLDGDVTDDTGMVLFVSVPQE